jgi:hypothetical protein
MPKIVKLFLAPVAALTTLFALCAPASAASIDRRQEEQSSQDEFALTYGWGIYANLWGYEVREVAAVLAGGGYLVGTGVCIGAAYIPHPVAKGVISAACTITGGVAVAKDSGRAFIDLATHSRPNDRLCYQVKLTTNTHAVIVNGSECS